MRGRCWRIVEAQHRVSTLKLVDTLAEQELLERLLEATKPPVPAECRHLHYLLATPFRYAAPYPKGSRFRRAGHTPGVFYGSERVETGIAEVAFHRLLFFAESPATAWPDNASEFTAFRVSYATGRGLDLTAAPLSSDRARWMHPVEYEACQALADNARAIDIQVLRYSSVRDPAANTNVALLTCLAFASSEPEARQSWRLRFSAAGAQALREHPPAALEFPAETFSGDPRIAASNRPG